MRRAERIGIVGAGVVGRAMAVALSGRYAVVGVASRSRASARACAALVGCTAYERPDEVSRLADVLLLSVPDDAIRTVCEQIASDGGFRAGQAVVHLSGALGSDALDSARSQGARVLSMHPIQTFVDCAEAAESLEGAYFSLEGDEEALALGRQLVRDLGGSCLVISRAQKPLYHAGLCAASNYLVALEGLAVELLERAGIDAQEALCVLIPLIRGTVRNLAGTGVPGALTGPIRRGDAQTVGRQLRAVQEAAPQYLHLYRELGALTLKVAGREGGLSPEAIEELSALLAADRPEPQAQPEESGDVGR